MHACASVPKPRLHPNPSPNQGFHDPEGVYSTFLVEYEPDTPRCAMFMGESMNQDNLPSAEYTAVADAVRAAVVARTAAAAAAAYAVGCEQVGRRTTPNAQRPQSPPLPSAHCPRYPIANPQVDRRTLAASLGQQPQLLMAFSSLAAPEAALEAVSSGSGSGLGQHTV